MWLRFGSLEGINAVSTMSSQLYQYKLCVYMYLPEHSVCGFHTKPELGHSGRDREDEDYKHEKREISLSGTNPIFESINLCQRKLTERQKEKYC